MKSNREGSSFTILHVGYQFFQNHLLKMLYFGPLCKKQSNEIWAFLWLFYSITLINVSAFVPGPYYYCEDDSVVYLKSDMVTPTATFLIFRIALAIKGLLYFRMKIWIAFQFLQIMELQFGWNWVKPVDCFSRSSHFPADFFLIYEHGRTFCLTLQSAGVETWIITYGSYSYDFLDAFSYSAESCLLFHVL